MDIFMKRSTVNQRCGYGREGARVSYWRTENMTKTVLLSAALTHKAWSCIVDLIWSSDVTLTPQGDRSVGWVSDWTGQWTGRARVICPSFIFQINIIMSSRKAKLLLTQVDQVRRRGRSGGGQREESSRIVFTVCCCWCSLSLILRFFFKKRISDIRALLWRAMSPSQSYLSCSWCWMLVHRVPRGFLCALANRIICEINSQNYILDNWRDQHQIIQLLKDSKRSLIGGLEFESSSPIKIFRPENCKSMWSLRSSLKKCDHQDFICVGACMDR